MRKKRDLGLVHSEIMECMDYAYFHTYEQRDVSISDRQFAFQEGAQWEGGLGEQFKHKPRFEVNKIQVALSRIESEYRNNRVSVLFTPKSDESEHDQRFADLCSDIMRSDIADSDGHDAIDNAFIEGVTGGMGGLRLSTVYENEGDPEDERQRVVFLPVFDADKAMFFDPNSQRLDKSDARYAFVVLNMTRKEFERQYPDAALSDVPTGLMPAARMVWFAKDHIKIAEYFAVEMETYALRHFVHSLDASNTKVVRADDEDGINEAELEGFEFDRERKVKRKRVRKYIVSGAEILEDCGYISGSEIPLVPFFGRRMVIDGVEHFAGHVRFCKDIQRLFNMSCSKMAEFASITSTSTPIFAPEQVRNDALLAHEWATHNIEQYAFLTAKPVHDVNGNPTHYGPVGYTKTPELPQGIQALYEMTSQSFNELIGSNESLIPDNSEMSGVAVEQILRHHDMQTYVYLSNFAKFMRRAGQVWLGIAKDIYDEDSRKLGALSNEDDLRFIKINEPVFVDGELKYRNSFASANLNVVTRVGAASASKRSATVRVIKDILPTISDPSMNSMMVYLMLMNMEGEGLSDVRKYAHLALAKTGVVEPNDKEAEIIQAEQEAEANRPKVDEALAMAEQAKAMKLEAEAQHEAVKVEKTMAEIGKIKAETDQTVMDTVLPV